MRPDRGRPAQYGWWAPVAALYRGGGGRGSQYEVHRAAYRPTHIPIRSRVSAQRREAPLRRHTYTHAHTVAHRHGQWLELFCRTRRRYEPLIRFPLRLYLTDTEQIIHIEGTTVLI